MLSAKPFLRITQLMTSLPPFAKWKRTGILNRFIGIFQTRSTTRKSSCMNARGTPATAYQVLPEVGYPAPQPGLTGGTRGGVPPFRCGQTDRHVSKHNLPVVLRTRSVTIDSKQLDSKDRFVSWMRKILWIWGRQNHKHSQKDKWLVSILFLAFFNRLFYNLKGVNMCQTSWNINWLYSLILNFNAWKKLSAIQNFFYPFIPRFDYIFSFKEGEIESFNHWSMKFPHCNIAFYCWTQPDKAH